jgi:hypothetical protein
MTDTTPDTFLGDVDVREIDWVKPAGTPAMLTPIRVSIGNGADGLEVALATAATTPRAEVVRRRWALRWSRRAAPVVVVAYPIPGRGWKPAYVARRTTLL